MGSERTLWGVFAGSPVGKRRLAPPAPTSGPVRTEPYRRYSAPSHTEITFRDVSPGKASEVSARGGPLVPRLRRIATDPALSRLLDGGQALLGVVRAEIAEFMSDTNRGEGRTFPRVALAERQRHRHRSRIVDRRGCEAARPPRYLLLPKPRRVMSIAPPRRAWPGARQQSHVLPSSR